MIEMHNIYPWIGEHLFIGECSKENSQISLLGTITVHFCQMLTKFNHDSRYKYNKGKKHRQAMNIVTSLYGHRSNSN